MVPDDLPNQDVPNSKDFKERFFQPFQGSLYPYNSALGIQRMNRYPDRDKATTEVQEELPSYQTIRMPPAPNRYTFRSTCLEDVMEELCGEWHFSVFCGLSGDPGQIHRLPYVTRHL